MDSINYMKTEFLSKSVNEAFARVAVAAFMAQLDPSLEELAEVKTAVSEAVTNSIIHGYENGLGKIIIECKLFKDKLEVIIKDFGKGIEDVEKARRPLFTTKPELERSGMGFTVMETFMDSLEVYSKQGEGTKIVMKKKLLKDLGATNDERFGEQESTGINKESPAR